MKHHEILLNVCRLLSRQLQLLGPQIGFIQLPSCQTIVEKKACSLLSIYPLSNNDEIERDLYERILKRIDDSIEGLGQYFGTLLEACLQDRKRIDFPSVSRAFDLIRKAMKQSHELLRFRGQGPAVSGITAPKEAIDEDVSWYFEESSEESLSPRTSVNELTDMDIIHRLCNFSLLGVIPPLQSISSDRPTGANFLIIFVYEASYCLWKQFQKNSSSFSSSFRHSHFFSNLSQSFTTTSDLDLELLRGEFQSSLDQQLQCKYIKGLSMGHSILANDSISINCYSESFNLSNQNRSTVFKYFDSNGEESTLPAVSCRRILCYSCDRDQEKMDYIMKNSSLPSSLILSIRSSNVSESQHLILSTAQELLDYHQVNQQFLSNLQQQWQLLEIQLFICYGTIMNDNRLHQQIIDICRALNILFVNITNPLDFQRCQEFFYHGPTPFLDHLLDLSIADCLEQEVILSVYTPLHDLAYSRGSGIEIGEFEPLHGRHYVDQEEEEGLYNSDKEVVGETRYERKELIKFGSSDYNCLIFLQFPAPPIPISPLLPQKSFVSLVLTSASMMQLQELYYRFFRNLNKLRIFLSYGGDVTVGQGLPELIQSHLLQEEVATLLHHNMASSSEDISLVLGIVQDFLSSLENYPRYVLQNNGFTLKEIEDRLQTSKYIIKRIVNPASIRLNSFLTSLSEAEFKQVVPIPPLLTNVTSSNDGNNEAIHWDLSVVKIQALELAIALVLQLLDIECVE